MKKIFFIRKILLSFFLCAYSLWGLDFTVTQTGGSSTSEATPSSYIEFELDMTDTIGTESETLYCTVNDGTEAKCLLSNSSSSNSFVIAAGIAPSAFNSLYKFRVYGKSDNILDGDQNYKVAISTTPYKYNSEETEESKYQSDPTDGYIFNLTNIDDGDDSGNIISTPSTDKIIIDLFDSTSSEDGDKASFSIVLSQEPTADVTINFASSNLLEGTLSTSSVTFNSSNWNERQRVDITGVDDTTVDGDIDFSILILSAISTDTYYSTEDASDLTITNLDNDVVVSTTLEKEIIITPVTGTTVTEGNSLEFNIKLNQDPLGSISLSPTISDGTVSPTFPTVLFDSTNWDTNQTITVSIPDNDYSYGEKTSTLSIVSTVITYPFPISDGVWNDSIELTIEDDDTLPISITATDSLTSESGDTGTINIELTEVPTQDVVFTIESLDESEGIVSSSTVTFTQAEGITNKDVTITGVDDSFLDFDSAYKIRVTWESIDEKFNIALGIEVVGSEGAILLPYNREDFDFINSDDETDILTITSIDDTTSENGETASFSVVLNYEPDEFVRVYLNSTDSTEGIVNSPSSGYLDFTNQNWDTPQVVTVLGVNDNATDSSENYEIELSPQGKRDSSYDGTVVYQKVLLTNTTPLITTDLSDQIQEEDGEGLLVELSSSPEAATSLSYNITTSNDDIAKVFVFNGDLVVIPIENAYGSVVISIITTVDGVTSPIQSFTYTLTSVNDAPIIEMINDIVHEQSIGNIEGIINFSIYDDDTTALSFENSNTELLSNDDISVVKLSQTQGEVNYEISANKVGTTKLTIISTDTDNLSTKESFNITVQASNDSLCVLDTHNALTFDTIKGNNIYQTSITDDLVLVDNLSEVCDTSITWLSSDDSIISNSGVVTQVVGESTIIMTATITKGTFSDTKDFLFTIPSSTITDQEALDNLLFEFIKADNLRKDTIVTSLNLLETIEGKDITWTSSDNSIINPFSGYVTRSSTDSDINLTATIGTASPKVFELTVLKIEVLDEDKVSADKALLTLRRVLGKNKDANSIEFDLNKPLPSVGANDSTITWQSSNENYITNEGDVYSDENSDKTVILTATIENGSSSDTKEFTLNVLQKTIDSNKGKFQNAQNNNGNLSVNTSQDGENKTTSASFGSAILSLVEQIISEDSIKSIIELVDKVINIYVYLNTDGSSKSSNENSDGTSSSIGSTANGSSTTIDDDGNVQTQVQTNGNTIILTLNSDGTVSHSVNGFPTFSSDIPGINSSVDENGTLNTSTQFQQNGFVYKLIVETNSEGNTTTKYVRIDVTTGEETQTQNTVSSATPFPSGSSVTLIEINGEIYISTRVPLAGNLVIE